MTEMTDLPDPRFCKTCGLWFGEYMACEDGDCELETWEETAKRLQRQLERAKKNQPRDAAEAELSKLAECVKALKAREAALREALEGVMPWMPKADSRCVPDEWVAAAKIISNTKDKSDGKKGK